MRKQLYYLKKTCLLPVLLMLGSVTYAQYCPVDFPSGVQPISLVKFAGINNATNNTSGPALENFTTQTGFVTQGQTYTISVKANTFGNYTDYIRVYIDWNQNNMFTDAGEEYDMGTITNSTGLDLIEVNLNITAPFTSTLGNTRMRVTHKWNGYATSCNTTGYGQAEDYTLNVLAGGSCTGKPTAGTASGPASVCATNPFTLTLTGFTSASGIGIQWEYNTGSGWQNLTGATTDVHVVSSGISVATSYRAVLTCSNGGQKDTSNAIGITINPFSSCYCPISFPNGTEPITRVAFGSINNITSATIGGNDYEDFTTMVATVIQGQSHTLTVEGNTDGNYTDSITAYIDWNQNGSFTDAGESYLVGHITNSTGTDGKQAVLSITVPFTSTLGNLRMRVVKKYNTRGPACNSAGYGQAEDYTLNVTAGSGCSGTPTPGTAAGPSSVCSGAPFTLTLTGFTAAAGISIQWQYMTASSGGWQDITGANNASHTVAGGITVPTDYRAKVVCSNGSGTAYSNILAITINPFTQCYCLIDFPSGVEPITLVDFANINNATPNTSSTAWENFTAISGTVTKGQTYTMTVKGNTMGNYSSYIKTFIDWNRNGLFTDPGEEYDLNTITNSTGLDAVQTTLAITIPVTAGTGTTGMRVTKKWNSYATACNTTGYGQAEDYTLIIMSSLAISLRDISAANRKNKNRIDWSTATEAVGDHFELEKSLDGKEFSTLASITAKGQPGEYTHWDEAPGNITYYRLKMMDAGGKIEYSKTVAVTIGEGSDFALNVYPNPATDAVNIIVYGSVGNNAGITISDVTGKVLKREHLQGNSISLSVADLPQGLYMIRYTDNNRAYTVKVNKQ